MKRYWEIIADNLSKAGWSWGYVATVDREGRTIFVADAHRGDGQRFVVHADEMLTGVSGTRSGDWSARKIFPLTTVHALSHSHSRPKCSTGNHCR